MCICVLQKVCTKCGIEATAGGQKRTQWLCKICSEQREVQYHNCFHFRLNKTCFFSFSCFFFNLFIFLAWLVFFLYMKAQGCTSNNRMRNIVQVISEDLILGLCTDNQHRQSAYSLPAFCLLTIWCILQTKLESTSGPIKYAVCTATLTPGAQVVFSMPENKFEFKMYFFVYNEHVWRISNDWNMVCGFISLTLSSN